ncbi:MAG: hypothetical protein HGA82_02950, partial [Anaerolineales bacterium]|nr:hypothetical protein [Anaerolineales bacterium]
MLCLAGLAGAAPEKTAKTPEEKNPAFAPITENPALPRVLLIGDSISIGYTLDVRKLLEGKANVLRVPTNCGPTAKGMKSLEEWLGTGKWDVIHFNWGLHDVKRMKDGKMDITGDWQVPPETYKANLEALVQKLKATGARLIWATTTPVPEGADGRVKDDEVKANVLAAKVMKANGVAVDDLYAHVLPQLQKYQRPKNVHFTDEGYVFLAKQVADSILAALQPIIADLGNIRQGHKIEDTYFALSSIVAELVKNKIVPVIIGGSQDLTFANYMAYESLGQVINIVGIDSVFDLGKTEQALNSQSYLNKIILHQPNFLFNYTNIGYQSYFVDPEAISLMKNLYFDVYRLGAIRENLEEAEPLLQTGQPPEEEVMARLQLSRVAKVLRVLAAERAEA